MDRRSDTELSDALDVDISVGLLVWRFAFVAILGAERTATLLNSVPVLGVESNLNVLNPLSDGRDSHDLS